MMMSLLEKWRYKVRKARKMVRWELMMWKTMLSFRVVHTTAYLSASRSLGPKGVAWTLYCVMLGWPVFPIQMISCKIGKWWWLTKLAQIAVRILLVLERPAAGKVNPMVMPSRIYSRWFDALCEIPGTPQTWIELTKQVSERNVA